MNTKTILEWCNYYYYYIIIILIDKQGNQIWTSQLWWCDYDFFNLDNTKIIKFHLWAFEISKDKFT